jgi:hypothetical protein
VSHRFRAILKSAAGYLAMAGVIAGLGYFMVQLFSLSEIFREITPDQGMTKRCVQGTDGALVCSQVPAAPTAPPGAPDPDAPLYVTLGVAE